MAIYPTRGRAGLRRGRMSAPGAEYFLTLCTDDRRVGLTTEETGEAVMGELRTMDCDGTWTLRCAGIMPDHIHILAILGERLPLGRSIQRLKAKTSASLRAVGIDWERDFFDHRLRVANDVLGVLLYIYLNPYRAGLLARTARWPWFHCRPVDWEWFRDRLDEERPPPEWLAM
jgi:putative transposase